MLSVRRMPNNEPETFKTCEGNHLMPQKVWSVFTENKICLQRILPALLPAFVTFHRELSLIQNVLFDTTLSRRMAFIPSVLSLVVFKPYTPIVGWYNVIMSRDFSVLKEGGGIHKRHREYVFLKVL